MRKRQLLFTTNICKRARILNIALRRDICEEITKQLLIVAFVALYLCGTIAAQETGDSSQSSTPTVRLTLGSDGSAPPLEVIKEWLLLGPLSPGDLDEDFLIRLLRPEDGDTVTRDDKPPLEWKRFKASGDITFLQYALGPGGTIAYAFCVLQSNAPSKAQIAIGHDHGVTVWINGKKAYENPKSDYSGTAFEVDLKEGANPCLIKITQKSNNWGFAVRVGLLASQNATISGKAIDAAGYPIQDAVVRLEQNGEIVGEAGTNESGNYRLDIHSAKGKYDLSISKGSLGTWRLGMSLNSGEHKTLDFTLRENISIQGTLLMLDMKTPHVAVPVQAIRNGQVIATAMSSDSGGYQISNLKPGLYKVRCHVLGRYVYYGDQESINPGNNNLSAKSMDISINNATDLEVKVSEIIEGIDFYLPPIKKGHWRTYDALDGLGNNSVNTIYRDKEGIMWLGTEGGGVSRFDGRNFSNLSAQDGLVSNWVVTINDDPQGCIWFGTWGGVSRYDGGKFANFSREDGLGRSFVNAIHCDPDGVVWFATFGGLSRYDGKEFINFTVHDGLPSNGIRAVYRNPGGILWLGTSLGVTKYDGKQFTNLRLKEVPKEAGVSAIYRDQNGIMWFGTDSGVVRYSEDEFTYLTRKDGLINNKVTAIYQDTDGIMWFGTRGGLSRYDGKSFVNFTEEDGLLSNWVNAIYGEPDGVLWFGTGSSERFQEGGLCRYDEKSLVSFDTRDGLPADRIWSLCSDPDGAIWIGTVGGGISRYDGESFSNFLKREASPGFGFRALTLQKIAL